MTAVVSRSLLLLLVLISSWTVCRAAHVPVSPSMQSFSYAIKGGYLDPGKEYLLYESNTGEPGVITEQWYTGMSPNTTIRIYIDNETLPSIEFQLYLGHGIGFVNSSEQVPWNTKRISLDASDGIYNAYQIPFSKSFRVTATAHQSRGGLFFWYIIKGVYNYPVVMGELQLPSNSRLRLYKNERVRLRPFEFLDLVKVQDTGGALFQVTLAAESTNFEYLEGCVRAYVDGGNVTFLSSGTEDFFLSAFYFNEGVFHSDNSGLTYFQPPGTMSAYKFFETDPLLFKRSLHLKWRCCEIMGTAPDDCPNVDKSSSPKRIKATTPDTSTVTTYTWVYEW